MQYYILQSVQQCLVWLCTLTPFYISLCDTGLCMVMYGTKYSYISVLCSLREVEKFFNLPLNVQFKTGHAWSSFGPLYCISFGNLEHPPQKKKKIESSWHAIVKFLSVDLTPSQTL